MPKLLSSAAVVKVFVSEGFIFISQRGSHGKFRKGSATVIVPMAKKEIPRGTFAFSHPSIRSTRRGFQPVILLALADSREQSVGARATAHNL